MFAEMYGLARLTRHQCTKLSLAAAASQTFQANNQRVAVNIAMVDAVIGGSQIVDISVDSVDIFHLSLNVNFVHYGTMDYGDLPQKAFTITNNGAATQVFGVIEWFLPEEYLAYCLCEFNTGYAKWLDMQRKVNNFRLGSPGQMNPYSQVRQ